MISHRHRTPCIASGTRIIGVISWFERAIQFWLPVARRAQYEFKSNQCKRCISVRIRILFSSFPEMFSIMLVSFDIGFYYVLSACSQALLVLWLGWEFQWEYSDEQQSESRKRVSQKFISTRIHLHGSFAFSGRGVCFYKGHSDPSLYEIWIPSQ